MNSNIINKIKEEPDLQDILDYLKKPLLSVEQIKDKYELLSIEMKNNLNNKEILFKLDNVISKHLVKMLNNYCSLSLKYRNENIVKNSIVNGVIVNYTAKELLLENLVKIIEEINILEESFNENNKFNFLVNNKLISQLGYQPTYINGEITKPSSMVLENKFNYEDFSSKQIVKENIKTKNQVFSPEIKKDISDQVFIKKVDKKKKNSEESIISFLGEMIFGATMIEMIIMVSFISMISIFIFKIFEGQRNEYKANTTVAELESIVKDVNFIKSIPTDAKVDINNKLLLQFMPFRRYIKDNSIVTSLGQNITIKTNNNNTQSISISNIEPKNCFYITNSLKYSVEKFTMKVNNHSANICDQEKNILTLNISPDK